MHSPLKRIRIRHAGGGAVPLARLTIAAQLLTAILIAVFLFTSSGVRLPFVDRPYDVSVLMDDVAGLDTSDHPQVSVGGVRAGTVTGVEFDGRTGRALVRMQLDGHVRGKLFADATARILPRSALQDLIVDVDPGDPSAGPLEDARIRRAAPAPVGHDRLLSVFDANTQAYAQVLLGTLRQVLKDREGPLRRALQQLPDTSDASRTTATMLAERRSDLTELVRDLERISAATGRRGVELTRAIDVARQTLAVTERRQQQLAESMDTLPAVLGQAGRTFSSVQELSEPLDPALERLRPASQRLPSALRDVRRLLPEAQRTLTDVRHLSRTGRAPLGSLQRSLDELEPVSKQLGPDVPVFGELISELVKNRQYLGRLADNWSGTLSGGDGFATYLRTKAVGTLPVDPKAFGLSGSPARNAEVARALTRFRRKHPRLVREERRTPLVVTAMRALLSGYCADRREAACHVLAMSYDDPPKVRSR